MCYLDKYNIDCDEYLKNLNDVLSVMKIESNSLEELNYDELISYVNKVIDDERVLDKLNDNWLDGINKSLSNHYRKIINIKKSDYEY